MTSRERLREQHRDIVALMKKIVTGPANDREARIAELTGKLNVHTRLEESIFYPALLDAGTKNAEEMVLESYEEHGLVDYLLSMLPQSDTRSEQILARLRVLQSLLEEHIEEEERELFKLVDRLGDDQVKRLDERMTEAMEEVEEVDALLERAARAAQRTERWAGSLLDSGWQVPRRMMGRLAPSRWITPRRTVWTARIVEAVPRVVVDSLYRTVVGRTPGHGSRRAA